MATKKAPDYHLLTKRWQDPNTRKWIAYEYVILKDNKTFLKCGRGHSLTREQAKKIVRLLNGE